MYRGSLVSFLGRTEKQRTMAFDMTRVFCYSVLQLVFQVSLLFKAIQKGDDIIENLISLYSAGADGGLHSMEKRSLLSVTLHRGIRVCSVQTIHSKSGPGDPNRAAKKFELSANLFKYATKGPKNDPKCPKVAQI